MMKKAKNVAAFLVFAAVAVRYIKPENDAWVIVEIIGYFVALPGLVVLSALEIWKSKKAENRSALSGRNG